MPRSTRPMPLRPQDLVSYRGRDELGPKVGDLGEHGGPVLADLVPPREATAWMKRLLALVVVVQAADERIDVPGGERRCQSREELRGRARHVVIPRFRSIAALFGPYDRRHQDSPNG